MGKPFRGKTLFAFLPAAAILLIGAILLNSCGQGNPAGSQTTGANPTAASPGNAAAAANIPLALTTPPVKVTITNASGTATASGASVTIAWDSYPGATSYNLYWANTPDYSDATKISGVSSPYAFKLPDSRKDYYFFLTGIINGLELRVNGDSISISKNGNRYNLIRPFDRLYDFLKKNGGQINALSNPLIPSAYIYDKYPIGPLQAKATISPGDYPWGTALYLSIERDQPQPDGSYIQESMFAAVISGPSPPPEVILRSSKWRYTYNPFTAQYLGTVTDLGQFTNTSPLNITYINSNPLPGSYFIDAFKDLYPVNLEVTIRGQVLPTYIGLNADLEASFTFAAAQSGISLTPASATAYLHPTPTHPQFKTTQTDANGTTTDITADPNTQWTVDPAIANQRRTCNAPKTRGSQNYGSTKWGNV